MFPSGVAIPSWGNVERRTLKCGASLRRVVVRKKKKVFRVVVRKRKKVFKFNHKIKIRVQKSPPNIKVTKKPMVCESLSKGLIV